MMQHCTAASAKVRNVQCLGACSAQSCSLSELTTDSRGQANLARAVDEVSDEPEQGNQEDEADDTGCNDAFHS